MCLDRIQILYYIDLTILLITANGRPICFFLNNSIVSMYQMSEVQNHFVLVKVCVSALPGQLLQPV